MIDFAAETWKTDRTLLSAAAGAIVNTRTSESLPYGKLAHGRKLTRVVGDDASTSPPEKWTIAGHSAAKVDGRSFVTGKHQYTTDMRVPGMWFGKVLRPAAIGATLASIDASAAQRMPDVVVVLDGEFVGVAAPTESQAARALASIKVEWKPGPKNSSKDLYNVLQQSGRNARQGRGNAGQNGGPIAAGLDAADVRLEQTYTIAYIAHAPLEPRAAVRGGTTANSRCGPGPSARSGCAASWRGVRIAPESVRVIVPDTGAGYGGKHTGEAAIEAARIARAAGKPIKLVWTREEEFTWAYFRPAGVIEIKSGVKRDGTLTAWEFHNYNSGNSGIRTPYKVAHQQVAHSTRFPSPLRQGSYRALASTANHFARESHMDELAHAVGLDPLAFRLKNLTIPGCAPSSRRRPRRLAGGKKAGRTVASASRPGPKRAATSRPVSRLPSSAPPTAFRLSVLSARSSAVPS